ncbi:MAG TPA: adenylate/guanylate cyclase domain-containing protein [Pseudaminobacter sp.]|jgi:adenylate cyclase|nr:adenylate/guanylate cyclase domain-containing protein [Pseudaminobacter sp.]
MERKLAAILAADVVGYSSLMERDEAGTFERLTAGRKELFEPEIEKRHGRIFKLMGDGLLAEFGSVVDAVECAVSLQRGLAERNANVLESERITVRIGVNLGEVIVDGGDRYGEGVNVAARLEQLAQPGGICVSGKVAREVEKKLAFGFEPMGDQQVKNMTEPVPAYRVVLDGSSLAISSVMPLALPNKPSIAVLPFTNMSGDPEQEYFADGLVEDLITSLSKMPGLFVIARNSTFAYKGKTVDIRHVAKELGVRYVLEGSVRKAANRLRITGQLVEGTDATHVWADKFEGAVEDIFDLQDRLTESIVGAMEPSLRRAEIERARRKRPDSLDAYDVYLRAMPHAYANTPANTDEALRLLNEALRLDPNYAAAHSYAAWAHEQRFLRGGFHPEDRAAALKHAHIALSIGTEDPQALCIGAFVNANITHDYESAIGALDRALKMNANSALAFGFSALVHMFCERYERASDDALKALRLSPFDPLNYHPYLALAWVCLFTGRFEEAASYSTLAIQANPGFSILHASLVASHANLDRLDQARAAAGRLLEMAPGWTIGGFVRMDLVRPHLMDGFATALRKAGLPE